MTTGAPTMLEAWLELLGGRRDKPLLLLVEAMA